MSASTHRWALASLKRRNQNQPILFINLWGFVSVLVTLFVAMLVTTHNGKDLGGTPVETPLALNSISMRGALREDAILVSIMRDGRLYFGTLRSSQSNFRVKSGKP